MSVEQTLILVKPDGVQRGLTGEIINRLEKRGLQIVGAKLIHPTRAIAEEEKDRREYDETLKELQAKEQERKKVLEEALKSGTASSIQPGERIKTSLKAIAYKGTERVTKVSSDGTVFR